MPFDFDPSRDRLPASPPEAPPTHRADGPPPVFDWDAPGPGSSDPTQLLRPADGTYPAANAPPSAASPPIAPPEPPTLAWPSPPSFPASSPPPGDAWPTTAELPAAAAPAKSTRTTLLVLLVVAALVASAFVGAGARDWLSTSSTTATPTPSTDGTLSDTLGGAEKPSTGSGSGSPATGATPDWAAVTDAIVPGVVDIEARMSGGVAAGTGMVLSESGEILTNNHVVEGARQIVVTVVSTGEEYSASIVGTDPDEDVAVLQLSDASGLTTIPLGDSDEVEVADPIVAIGNAGGVGGPPDVAIGKVVALHQQITAGDQHGNDTETLVDMIQVDAEVVAGDSGGPLADADGEVVGMNTAAASSNGRFQTAVNQAFAIPINRALAIAEQLTSGSSNGSANGSSSDPSTGSGGNSSDRGFLGVQVQTGTAGGAEVVGVVTGSAAAEAGVEAGDVIVGLDGAPVTTADDLTAALQSSQSGDEVQLTWQAADGRTRRATVELQAA